MIVAWLTRIPSDSATFYLRPICLEFGLGLACAWFLRQSFGQCVRLPWIALLAVGIGAFVAGGLLHPAATSWARLACALGAGTIITAMVRLEQSGMLRAPHVSVVLGGASYSIYLVHYAVISLLAIRLARLHVHSTTNWALVLAAGGVASGIAFNVFVDQPVQSWLRARKNHWVRAAPRPQRATAH